MVRGASGAFVPGTAAAEYARSLGVELVETAPNAIDASVFERAAVDRSIQSWLVGPVRLGGGRPQHALEVLGRVDLEVAGRHTA